LATHKKWQYLLSRSYALFDIAYERIKYINRSLYFRVLHCEIENNTFS
jgi:hypothetical protein